MKICRLPIKLSLLPNCLLFSFTVIALPPDMKLEAEGNHSTIQFSVPISNGLTRITGKFTDFSIKMNYLNNDITNSKISTIINVNSINTGIPSRDQDLKTKDFFETDKYPEITFISDSVKKGSTGFIVFGKFQMHGITKQTELPFTITGNNGGGVIGFTSRYVIKRSDFGLGTDYKHTVDDNFIGNDISIEIDFWTKKEKKK